MPARKASKDLACRNSRRSATAQMPQPLASAVIGGVSVSMVLSLLITPVLFYVLRRRGL